MTKTPAHDKSEAVAAANGFLSDHSLPNVNVLTKALYDLLQVARLSLPENDARVVQAGLAVQHIAPYVGGNILAPLKPTPSARRHSGIARQTQKLPKCAASSRTRTTTPK